MDAMGSLRQGLLPYSDRIAQDFHLIPSFPPERAVFPADTQYAIPLSANRVTHILININQFEAKVPNRAANRNGQNR